MKKLFAVAAAGVVFSSTAFCAVSTDGTQTRNSASERVPLISLVMPALQQLSKDNEIAGVCLNILTNPTMTFKGQVAVSVKGEADVAAVNKMLSEFSGTIVTCTEALALRVDDVFSFIEKLRPGRNQATEIIENFFGKSLTNDFYTFRNGTPESLNIPTFVAAGNNGFATDYIYFRKRLPNGDFGDMNIPGSGFVQGFEAKNYPYSIHGSPAREAVIGGVYAFFTNPFRLDTLCVDKTKQTPGPAVKVTTKGNSKALVGSARGASMEVPATDKTYPCSATYVVKFDGTEVKVTKNGQRWFDADFIGGASYTIELSGEKSNSTTRKVER